MNRDGKVAKSNAAVFFALLSHQNHLLESLLATLPSESIPPLADTLVDSSMLPLVPESEDDWQAVAEKTLANETTESLFDFLEFLKAGKAPQTVSTSLPAIDPSTSSRRESSRASSLFGRRRHGPRGGHSTSPPPALSVPLTLSAPAKPFPTASSSPFSPVASPSSSFGSALSSVSPSTSSSQPPPPVPSTSPPSSRHHILPAISSPVKKKKSASDLLNVLPKRRASLANVDSLMPLTPPRGAISEGFFIGSSAAVHSTSASSLSSSSMLSLASSSSSSMSIMGMQNDPYNNNNNNNDETSRGPSMLLLVPMVERAMMFELKQSKDRTVLFRSDSNAMIFVSHLLRQFGNPYLRQLLAPSMSEMLSQSRNNFELDPTRLNKKYSPEQLAKKTESRRKRLLSFCNSILRTVFESASHFPLPLLKISRALYRLLLSQDLDEQQACTFVRSLLFLRWICPLLLTEQWVAAPASGTRSSQRKRSIILVGKLIQSAANGVPPSEPYLDFASDFIERSKRSFARFVRVVTVDYLPIASPAAHRSSKNSNNAEHRCPEHLCPCFSHLHQTVDFDLLHALAIGTPLLPYAIPSTPIIAHFPNQQQQHHHHHHQQQQQQQQQHSSLSASPSHELSRTMSLPRATSPSSSSSIYMPSSASPPPFLSTTPLPIGTLSKATALSSSSDSPKPNRRGGSSIVMTPSSIVHHATTLSISPTKNTSIDPFDSPLSYSSADNDLNEQTAEKLLSLLADIAGRWTAITQILQQRNPEPSPATQSQWELMQQLTQPLTDSKLLDDTTFDLVKPAFDSHQMFIWTLDPSLNVEVLVYSQPSPRAQPKGRLFRGADIRLLNQFHLNWVKVKIDDVIGWIQYTLLGKQVLFPSIGVEPTKVVSWLNYQLDSIQDLLEEMCLR